MFIWLRIVLPSLVVVASAFTTACTYHGEYLDSPIQRSLSWFSYLNGDDMRAVCTNEGRDRYRIVYNGVREEQVRTYDLAMRGDGGADLMVQVRGVPDVSGPIPLHDLLAPWRGEVVHTQMSADQARAIRMALAESGFEDIPPGGTRIFSDGFFWLVAACQEGHMHFNAWSYTKEDFRRVTLAGPLEAVDPTNVPFNPPRAGTVQRTRQEFERGRDRYEFVVRADGLVGLVTPF